MSVIPSLLDTKDCLMSDSVDYREPETYHQSLLCAEAPKWRLARKREGDALFERKAMQVVSTPPQVQDRQSRGVYTSVGTTRVVRLSSTRHV